MHRTHTRRTPTRIRSTAVAALGLALALTAGLQTPAHADFHTMGAGAGTSGAAQATPALTTELQPGSMRLDFDAVGAAYFVPFADPSITWDCRHDPETEGDRPELERDGFVFTSLMGDNLAAGAGSMAGRCTGTPSGQILNEKEAVTVACPSFLVAQYARVGTVIQGGGTCLFTWSWQFVVGDFTITAVLNPSEDNENFSAAAVAFRWRG